MGKLDGKVAFITGAASGLGKAQATLFVKEGAKVVLADLNFDGVKNLADELSETGENVLPVKVNVTDRNSVQEAVKLSVEKFNGIDILSNTAGAFDGFKNLLDTNDELWGKVVNINLNSLYIVTQEVLPVMLKRGKGNVISISSGAGLVGGGGGISYTSTKHAVIGFTKQIAADYGTKGIRSNAICPGLITTPMTTELTSNPDFVKYIESLPGGRIGVPDDIAKAALFLASDDSDYIHGVALPVDGGLVAK
jgi:3-oxoacyl-[acyl-carrier protein] reductase